MTGLNIALLVAKWSDQSTVLTWAWLRRTILRPGKVDHLFIVHNGKHANWKAGGPLGPDLDTALANYQHEIHVVDGTIQANIDAFVAKHNIHIVVLSEDFPAAALQMTSPSDWVKQHIGVPFIIIRQSAVRNQKLRLKQGEMSPLSSEKQSIRPSSPDSTRGRKIGICYSSFPIGLKLIDISKNLILTPRDEVYLLHCFPSEATTKAKKIIKTVTLQRHSTSFQHSTNVTEEPSTEFGAAELEGYAGHCNVALRGDVKAALTAFCESESIDLLIIGTRGAGRIKKTLTGGSVSGHLIDHAPCPCLVIPYKSIGIVDQKDEDGVLSPRATSVINAGGGGTTTLTEAAERIVVEESGDIDAGRVYLEEQLIAMHEVLLKKDKVIKELQDEVERLKLEKNAS